jgi:hypothetical protein
MLPGGERWTVDRRSRTTKAWLDHIALTGAPAYESAKVLAVRSAPRGASGSATPNLDEVLAWLLDLSGTVPPSRRGSRKAPPGRRAGVGDVSPT